MARIDVYIPDDLHRLANRARFNVSLLTQQAIRDELARAARLKRLHAWLDAASAGEPAIAPRRSPLRMPSNTPCLRGFVDKRYRCSRGSGRDRRASTRLTSEWCRASVLRRIVDGVREFLQGMAWSGRGGCGDPHAWEHELQQRMAAARVNPRSSCTRDESQEVERVDATETASAHE